MRRFDVSTEYHVTYTIGMVRAEAEVILKLVHSGLIQMEDGSSTQDIGYRFMKCLQNMLTKAGETKEDHQ